MIVELTSRILLVADLAHNQNFRAVSLYVVIKLRSCHVLELGSIADVTSKLGAIELSVSLKFTEGLPDDDLLSVLPASMWEFTEINAVLKNLVYFLEKVSTSLAIGAAYIEARSLSIVSHLTTTTSSSSSISAGRHKFIVNLLSDIIPLNFIIFILNLVHLSAHTLLELQLAILTEKLVAVFALKRLEWELKAHDALDLFHHFALKLILDFIHLNIE